MHKRNKPDESLTDFGYQKVPTHAKTHKVFDVFRSVAPKYDLMNDLMSLGIHRLWKRYAVALANLRDGQHVLDLAGGTGDLAKAMIPRLGDHGSVVLCDINNAMLERGRDRLIDAGIARQVTYVQANAEALPFGDQQFDLVTMAFGLRNVTHQDQALQEIFRVLKPGGKLLVLEFSQVTQPMISKLYDAYSFGILPKLGRLIAQDADSYRYLAESIRRHPDQPTLQRMFEAAGFVNCDYQNLSFGIVAIHRGYKA